jgi:molybdenum ABC transporter molybdate-binding protein
VREVALLSRMTAQIVAAVLVGIATMNHARAETVTLYAAGSLKDALSEVAKTFAARSGNKVATKFGPSGVLKDEIAGGAKADLFASANMTHPKGLHEAGKAGPVTRFARNKLCALVKPGLDVTSATLLARMLDDKIKLGTSTPKADPSGDYAFESFAKAEAINSGAKAALEAKALKLTGAKDSATPPAGRIAYGWHVDEGRADIFLTYCTNALAARKQYSGQQTVELPETLAVGADYGLTVIDGAPPAAQALADYIMSPDGQTILTAYGFAPGK